MLDLYIIPSDGNQILDFVKNQELYNFTWEVVYYRWNFMYIQLNFTHPGYVSSQQHLDSLGLKVNKTYAHMFYSDDIDEYLDKGWYNLTHQIPRQERTTDNFYSFIA